LLQDSSFAGYSVLRTIQPLNLATRLILLPEDCETDLVTHGSSLLSKREEGVVANRPLRMPQPTDGNRRRYRSGPIGI
jgi:hypothetical protein